MHIDITSCNKVNVIDTCAIWNILSSKIFYSVLNDLSFDFTCTNFVLYECLHKKRSEVLLNDQLIKDQFKKLIETNGIKTVALTIEDLQDDGILANRKKIGKGELSSIAFAKKTRLCFHTDDQHARKIATKILGLNKVQTSPLLLGWLLYNGHLSDRDLEPIITEHNSAGRPLEKYFREVHEESWRIKLLTKAK